MGHSEPEISHLELPSENRDMYRYEEILSQLEQKKACTLSAIANVEAQNSLLETELARLEPQNLDSSAFLVDAKVGEFYSGVDSSSSFSDFTNLFKSVQSKEFELAQLDAEFESVSQQLETERGKLLLLAESIKSATAANKATHNSIEKKRICFEKLEFKIRQAHADLKEKQTDLAVAHGGLFHMGPERLQIEKNTFFWKTKSEKIHLLFEDLDSHLENVNSRVSSLHAIVSVQESEKLRLDNILARLCSNIKSANLQNIQEMSKNCQFIRNFQKINSSNICKTNELSNLRKLIGNSQLCINRLNQESGLLDLEIAEKQSAIQIFKKQIQETSRIEKVLQSRKILLRKLSHILDVTKLETFKLHTSYIHEWTRLLHIDPEAFDILKERHAATTAAIQFQTRIVSLTQLVQSRKKVLASKKVKTINPNDIQTLKKTLETLKSQISRVSQILTFACIRICVCMHVPT